MQSALMKAVQDWGRNGQPEQPAAWLYRVARNELIGELRKSRRQAQLLEQFATDLVPNAQDELHQVLPGEMRDDLLRMLFVACDEVLPAESQLVFALKTLCGFNVPEIAQRLFMSEAAVYKRLARARDKLKAQPVRIDQLDAEHCRPRLANVLKTIYVLFTEGHLSSHADAAIRCELCDEAIRLATVLVEHPVGQVSECFALLALMHLHRARLSARLDGSGGLLLLEDQDRSRWNQKQIGLGLSYLSQSAQGDQFTRYHAEAAIAAEHCMAPSFDQTRWHKIVEYYDLLERAAPSPIHTLNRAVAVAEWQGPQAALAALEAFPTPQWLLDSYLWSAVMADLHRRAGHSKSANRFHQQALKMAPTDAIRALLQQRLKTALRSTRQDST